MSISQSIGRFVGVLALLALVADAASAQQAQPAQPSRAAAPTQKPVTVRAVNGVAAGQFVVSLGKSQILQVDQPFSEINVGNPAIADVVPLTRQSVYVLGKALGSTNLVLMRSPGNPLAVVDVVVSHDIEGLKQRLFDIMPDEKFEVRPAAGGLVLSGQVTNQERLSRALALAEQYAPGKITNLLTVGGSSQVMLEVRFAEVDRQVGKALSLSTLLQTDNLTIATGIPGAVLGAEISPFASVIGRAGDFTGRLDALERKGMITMLAEPNLVVMSGDTASFLAGGEFPIPVAQNASAASTAITVEFKQFGVGLNFTPTVIGKDLINVVIKTEVSDLDRSVAAQSTFPGGVQIPGLRVRRTETTVEMRDGQAFAVSGLLRQDFSDTVSQLPWLADVPVLGALFRSTQYQQQKTELVVFITTRLVQPAAAGSLAVPHDYTRFPSEADIFLGGKIEGGANRPRMSDSAANSGVTGVHGYIVK